MASNTYNLDKDGFTIVLGDIKVNVDLGRFGKQYQMAQFALDSQVMTDMEPYMPRITGTFINLTKAQSAAMAGTGRECAGTAPMGRYLYFGKKMVDSERKGPRKIPTGPGEFVWRYKKGAKLIATDKPLTYSNPKATPEWFETAKKIHGKSWVSHVKETAGGG